MGEPRYVDVTLGMLEPLVEFIGVEEMLVILPFKVELHHRSILTRLAKRFGLAPSRNFHQFLEKYDRVYPTMRSFLYHDADTVLRMAMLGVRLKWLQLL
jgi:hypothetical protein